MGVVHFMNVKEGDCIWVKHPSGRNTVIDVCNGNSVEETEEMALFETLTKVAGNHKQKLHSVNPVEYLNNYRVSSIFRFILTHPDMDHMDGIKKLFDTFDVVNLWDTANNKVIDNFKDGKYKQEDWDFYQEIRKSESNPKVLHLYSGACGEFYNQTEDGNSGADGLYLLAPTKTLVDEANESGDYNDSSYVVLYRTGNSKRILFAGDSSTKTWDYLLKNHEDDVTDIDVLIAPHHGRKSGGNDDFLDTVRPKLTLFGNAKAKDLDYQSWNNKDLQFITNNQANCVILDTDNGDIEVYVTYEKFARKLNKKTYYNDDYDAWYVGVV